MRDPLESEVAMAVRASLIAEGEKTDPEPIIRAVMKRIGPYLPKTMIAREGPRGLRPFIASHVGETFARALPDDLPATAAIIFSFGEISPFSGSPENLVVLEDGGGNVVGVLYEQGEGSDLHVVCALVAEEG